jgi:hypothetical protein
MTKIQKLLFMLLFIAITISCLPEGKYLNIIKVVICGIITIYSLYIFFIVIEKEENKYEKDVFKKTVEATLRLASELGFNPQISSNEIGNGTGLFHIDPEHNLVHLMDLEVPEDNASEAEINEVIELNREKLTELAKNITKNKEEKK